MVKNNVVSGIENVVGNKSFCEGRVYGKMHRQPDLKKHETLDY